MISKHIIENKTYIFVLLALLFALFSCLDLFAPGLHPTHDGEYHVVRFYEFYNTLASGDTYPVWASSLNFGYGVPLFNYVYPFSNYVGSAFHFIGFSFIDSFKLNLVAAILVGSLTSFALGKQKFGNWGGLLTSVFYTFAPYHLLDTYIRGSVGEVWALAFFPLPFLFVNKFLIDKKFINLVFISVSLSLIIFSHNILSLMFAFFVSTYVLIFWILSKSSLKDLLKIGGAFIYSLLLVSGFVFPALIEKNYVVGLNTFNYRDHFAEVFQLLIPSWGHGFSGIGSSGDQMSLQVGAVNLLVLLIIGIGFLLRKVKREKAYILFFFVWFFVLCFLITSYSLPIWELITPMGYFQFPWRLLSLVILCAAILSGGLTILFKHKIMYAIIIVLMIFTTYSYTKTPFMMERSDEFYTKNSSYIHGTNSIGNGFQTKWLESKTMIATHSAVFSLSNEPVDLVFKNSTSQKYKLDKSVTGEVVFSTAYFPGWKVFSETGELAIYEKNGLIAAVLDKPVDSLELKYHGTTIRLISEVISISSWIFVAVLLVRYTVLQFKYGNRY